jgi:hypothetical protein
VTRKILIGIGVVAVTVLALWMALVPDNNTPLRDRVVSAGYSLVQSVPVGNGDQRMTARVGACMVVIERVAGDKSGAFTVIQVDGVTYADLPQNVTASQLAAILTARGAARCLA